MAVSRAVVSLVLLGGLGLAGAVTAQSDPDPAAGAASSGLLSSGPVDPVPDGIGVFFDPDATTNCVSLPPGEHPAYLIVTDPSEGTGISGWECQIEVRSSGSCFVLDWGIQGQVVNVSTPPVFTVGLAETLLFGPAILLLDMTLLLVDEGPVLFFVRPTPSSALPAAPCYAAGGDPSHLVPLTPFSGSADLPVASINQECHEEPPWRALKTRH